MKTKSVLFILFFLYPIAWSASLCHSYYGASITAGPSLKKVSTVLEANEVDQNLAIQRVEKQSMVSENEHKRIQEFNAAIEKARREQNLLTPELARTVVRDLRASGFFMGAFHEQMIKLALGVHPDWSSSNFDYYIRIFSSGAEKDQLTQKWAVDRVIDNIKFNVRYRVMDSELRKLSEKKLARIIDVLRETVNDPAKSEVLRIVLQQSLFDITKVVKGRHLGAFTAIVGHLGGLFSTIAPAMVSLVASAHTPGIWEQTFGSFVGGSIPTAGILGTVLFGKLYTEAVLNESKPGEKGYLKLTRLGGKLTAVPKESLVYWRRWKQRKSIEKLTENEIDSRLLQTEFSMTFDQLLGYMKADMNKDFTNPVNISFWAQPLADVFDRVLSAEKILGKKFDKIAKKLSDDVLSVEQLKKSNEEFAELQFEYTELGHDILAVSHAADMYTAKASEVLQSGVIREGYQYFFKDKQAHLIEMGKSLENLARAIALRNDVLLKTLNTNSLQIKILEQD